MIDHAALADAILEPAFPRPIGGSSDHQRDEHLATCRECRATLAGVRGDAARIAAFQAGEPSPWVRHAITRATRPAVQWAGLGRILVFALLTIGLAGAGVVGVGSFLGPATPEELTPGTTIDLNAAIASKAFVWRSASVVLAADQATLSANGAVMRVPASDVKVGGQPGGPAAGPTLEIAWIENLTEQRISIYIDTNATNWWVREIRAYDNVGRAPEWTNLAVPSMGAPFGVPVAGDLEISGAGRAGPVALRVSGLVLSAFQPNAAPKPVGLDQPPNVGVVVPAAEDPFAPGGALRCSGILQLAPKDAERELANRGIRVSWQLQAGQGPKPQLIPQPAAPEKGWISSTTVGKAGELLVIVEDPEKPMAPPIAHPADCPPLPSAAASAG